MKHVGVTMRVKMIISVASGTYVFNSSHSSSIIELLRKATTKTL